MEMFGFFGRNPPGAPPTFRIFCKADKGSCLAVRDGTLVLAAPADPSDERQHWFKDVSFNIYIQDKEGNPVFSLVNKATGLAIQHPLGPSRPVRLMRFYPDDLNESVLWTESGDMCMDFCCIRMMHNIRYYLDARETAVVVSNGTKSDSQSWKMAPWIRGRPLRWIPKDELTFRLRWIPKDEPTFRICCRADQSLSITIRNGTVCLASTNARDECQHWFYDMRPGEIINDEDGFPAFALINKVTGEAIAGSADEGCSLKLKPYNPNYLDGSVLWTMGFDMGYGFRCIHMVDNISLNFNACEGDDNQGWIQHGAGAPPTPMEPPRCPPNNFQLWMKRMKKKRRK